MSYKAPSLASSAETNREHIIDAFLSASGWQGVTRAPLAGDASNRRYERLSHPEKGPAVLMDAPPWRGEDVRPFVTVTEIVRRLGLSAPEVYAGDPASGLLLLEDLGDDLLARVIAGGTAEEPLYKAAIDLLVALHDRPVSDVVGAGGQPLPPYDLATLLREVRLVTAWYCRGAAGRRDEDRDLSTALERTIAPLLSDVAAARDALVLRDYHAENLLWLPAREGHARVGLLDYQDALIGHPAYDLVSLLEDARRDVPKAVAAAMIERYLSARPSLDPQAFRAAYACLGAQRNLKIVGIFARLWLREGKDRYLDLIPRVWGYLQEDLAHPALAPLRAFVVERIPTPTVETLVSLRRLEGGTYEDEGR
ncbi:MAG: phosphotransferase [Pseudomonadota bacterium]